jgi:hypothetical protein
MTRQWGMSIRSTRAVVSLAKGLLVVLMLTSALLVLVAVYCLELVASINIAS